MDLTDYRLHDELASSGLLSPETLDFLHTTAFHPHSPVQIFKRHTAIKLQQALNIAYVFLAPLIDQALALLTASPGLASLAAFVALLAAAWIVLGWIRRLMLFATRMVFRLVFWAAVVAVGSAVVRNGVFETVKDAVVVGGKIMGFLAVAKDVWVGELRRYEEEARVQGRR
ncbi:hypothetical protein VD0004_g3774 [Verticillium dahliae]|uniref:Uncharacterized protein n=1 Tax=Verticillium dahliae TaxID=27337 RepID=A0A2J8D3B6_VERDA|nr:hypothetical protein VD0004_g3774 [Verticillium dahliae]PNH57156.1 hypothetical protein VD0003_g583 [Verticillium dahliae]PNH73856.1 hypothetical protein VD0001_g3714 [Verticillium dahliae]RXG46051.1 hypothetical protein VDGE_03274 [Verticillium dahliae]